MTTFDDAATAREQAPGGIAHEAGELHRLLVESVEDYAIFALDPDGRILSWNAGARRFKGYSAEEVVGRHFSIFYPADKIAEGWPAHELKEAARVGRFEDEGWRVRKDGSRFWANVVITALRSESGELLGYAKVTRDLTERLAGEARAIDDARRVAAEEAARQAADVARERSERLQTLTSELAAVRTIAEITRVLFDQGFPASGVDAGSLAIVLPTGTSLRIVADTGYDALLEDFRTVAVDAEVPVAVAVRDARTMVFLTRAEREAAFPLTTALLASFDGSVIIPLLRGGRAIGALAMHRRARPEVVTPLSEDTVAFMESVAQQCGQALERAQLYEAERLARQEAEEARKRAEEARTRAEEANHAKSQFLAAMSHELRTPLNAIGGYSQLMELGVGGAVSEEHRSHLARIQRSQQHLLGIINDILNFARVDAGQIAYVAEAVPMHEVVESVTQMLMPQARTKALVVEVGECTRDAVAWADRAKVEQIVVNLLTNAVKFTGPGGRVTLDCRRAATGVVECRVVDTGSGIAPEQFEAIFEPFVQVGRALTATHEGTGLGLAISRDLARAMGGDIAVESAVGAGSTFTLVLPGAIGGG